MEVTTGGADSANAKGRCQHGSADLPARQQPGTALPTADEFAEAGLFDPRAADADERLNLLRLIAARGGSIAAMGDAARSGALVTLAAELAFMPPGPRYNLEQVAVEADMPLAQLQALRIACQLPDIDDQAPSLTGGDVALARAFGVAAELFGDDQTIDFVRVVAASTARIADAAITMFVTSAGPASLSDDRTLVDVTARTAALNEALLPAIDTLLHHHLVRLARPNVTGVISPFEVRDRAVGFVDLVGFTRLAGSVSLEDLGHFLVSFERTAADVVTLHGGRVIKFLGDEVMFAADGLDIACDIALALLEPRVGDQALYAARAGIAAGQLLVRDGDCFGPTVNLAARAVRAAAPGSAVVASDGHPDIVGHEFETRRVPDAGPDGVSPPVELHVVTRRPGDHGCVSAPHPQPPRPVAGLST